MSIERVRLLVELMAEGAGESALIAALPAARARRTPVGWELDVDAAVWHGASVRTGDWLAVWLQPVQALPLDRYEALFGPAERGSGRGPGAAIAVGSVQIHLELDGDAVDALTLVREA